jgi:hypothetical protein
LGCRPSWSRQTTASCSAASTCTAWSRPALPPAPPTWCC